MMKQAGISTEVMELVDERGRDLPTVDWIDLLREIGNECQARIEAARDDLRRRGK